MRNLKPTGAVRAKTNDTITLTLFSLRTYCKGMTLEVDLRSTAVAFYRQTGTSVTSIRHRDLRLFEELQKCVEGKHRTASVSPKQSYAVWCNAEIPGEQYPL